MNHGRGFGSVPQVMGIVEGNYYMLDLFYSKPHTVLELGPYLMFSAVKSRSPNSDEIRLAIAKFGCAKCNLGFHLDSCLQFLFLLIYFLAVFRLAFSHEKIFLDSLSSWSVLFFWYFFLFSSIYLVEHPHFTFWSIHFFFLSPAVSQGRQDTWRWQIPGVDLI